VSRPWHSAKNKSLPSATTMALGKEIKELKNIYLQTQICIHDYNFSSIFLKLFELHISSISSGPK